MKKILSIMLVSAAVLLSACTKDNEDPIIPTSGWSLNINEHLVTTTSRTTANAEAAIVFKDETDGGKESVTVSFKALPAASGTYQLVNFGADPLIDNQCHIALTDDTGNALAFNGTPATVDIIVTEKNKIIITIPEVNVGVPSPGASYKFKASLYEL